MTGTPEQPDFSTRWRALDSTVRKDLVRLANAGETSEDPYQAWLVAGYSLKRLRPIEMVASAVGALVGYIVIAEAILAGSEPAILFGLAVGVVAFLIFQRRRLLRALHKSNEVIEGDSGSQEI